MGRHRERCQQDGISGDPGKIHVSEAFANTLRSGDTSSDPLGDTIVGSVTIEPRGSVEIKGKGTMNTYWLASEIKN